MADKVMTIEVRADHEGMHAKVVDEQGDVIAQTYEYVRNQGSWQATRDAVVQAVKVQAGQVLGWGEPPAPESIPWTFNGQHLNLVGPSGARDHRLFVNLERTVMARVWSHGLVEVATREDESCIWGPPQSLEEESY